LKRKSRIISPHPATRKVAARLLLGLMLHVLFIITTHHHPIRVSQANPSTPSVSQDSHTPEQHLPHSNDDLHCATCSLQRGVASQHSAPLFIFELSQQGANREFSFLYLHTDGVPFESIGRAPPLV
jgi:hypothetical protein